MSRFADVLNQVRDRLEIPEPSRTRIVLEMASDLEDSYQYYLDQGHDEAEAARLARETFDFVPAIWLNSVCSFSTGVFTMAIELSLSNGSMLL